MSKRDYKGALHTLSFTSDGRSFPEEVVSALRQQGYNLAAGTVDGTSGGSPRQDDDLYVCAESGSGQPVFCRSSRHSLSANARPQPFTAGGIWL